MKQVLEDKLLELGMDRDSLLIGLGGGVISDLVGFLAATYMRGIDYFLIPTTFMAMVDASIGGKTSVNTPHGKNLIGAFHFPKRIFCEPLFLKTLPEIEMRGGFVEVIKYGLIWDEAIFRDIGKRTRESFIARSIEIKEEIVQKDPYERSGLRKILNFGHTIGHALEQIKNYEISHGEAVWNGLLMESYLSWKKGFLSLIDLEDIVTTLFQDDVRLEVLEGIDKNHLYEVMRRDKKSVDLTPHIVTLKRIGSVRSTASVSPEEIGEALKWQATISERFSR